jgi:hypothetical protein
VNTQDDASKLEDWDCELEKRSTRLPILEWRTSSTSSCWNQNQLRQQSPSSGSLESDCPVVEDEDQPIRYQVEIGVNKLLCVESIVDVSGCDYDNVV